MQKQILIVDSEPSITFFLVETLAELGTRYHTETCSSGAEALLLNAIRPFDIIILDTMIWDMNGFKLIRLLRHQTYRTEFILMTPYGNHTLLTTANVYQTELIHQITKPFKMDELLFLIKSTLMTKGKKIIAER